MSFSEVKSGGWFLTIFRDSGIIEQIEGDKSNDLTSQKWSTRPNKSVCL